jgi:hypothetical protein
LIDSLNTFGAGIDGGKDTLSMAAQCGSTRWTTHSNRLKTDTTNSTISAFHPLTIMKAFELRYFLRKQCLSSIWKLPLCCHGWH